MAAISNIVLFILLGAIVYQDFKFRAIHVFLLLGIFISGILLMWVQEESFQSLFNTIVFIGIVLFFLWIYIIIKNKGTKNSIQKSIGLGDIIFFFAVTPLFSLENYMLFFISGMIVTLVFYLLFRMLMKNNLIPLAGILSGYLILLKGISILFNLDLFHKPILINAFGN